LGIENFISTSNPTKIIFKENEKIVEIFSSTTSNNTFLLTNGNLFLLKFSINLFKKENKLYSCGKNNFFQAGINSTENINTPKLIEFSLQKKIIKVFPGLDHSFFITKG
jgi:alpha-tubulin suppressor-like RCC1 family protein